jgi:Glycosyltransferase family 87
MKRSSWLILACASLLHLGLLIGWRFPTPLVPYFFDATVLSGGRGLDFYSIYQAGYNARHGQDIYEGDPTRVTVVVPYFTPYRYLPPVAYTLGAALSVLPPLTAYKLWVVLVEMTLLLCAVTSLYVTRAEPDLGVRLAAMWLVFSPYYLELFMGQFSLVQAGMIFVMLLMASGTFIGTDQTLRVSRSALRVSLFDTVWVASMIWKINTVVFVPVLARLRRWRALVAGGLITAAVTLPYFAIFPAHLRDFVANNFGNTVSGHELGNLGFRQLVYELLAVLGADATVQRLAQICVVGMIVLAALALTFWPRAGQPTPAALLSLWLVTFFLISPQVWEHHYVMLLPALVVAYRQRPGWLLAGLWLLLALPTPFGFTDLQPAIAGNHDLRGFLLSPAWQFLLQHASKAVPTALLFAYFSVKVAVIPDKASGIIAPAYQPAMSPSTR